MTLTIGSLCSGAGMLDVAAAVTLGDARTAWVCETDPDASRVLAERFGVPNHGDIRAVEWSAVEPVDVLVAGYPCQDFSNAGRRAGMEGDRGALWFDVARAVGVLRPRLVLLENVSAHLVRGFPRVLGDLASMGYDATWGVVRASDAGAPHQRARIFVVAADPDREPVRLESVAERARQLAAVPGSDSSRPDLNTHTHTLLPTPVARDHKGTGHPGQLGTLLLPTPTASEATGPGRSGKGGPNLRTAVDALFPTPTASRADRRGQPSIDVAASRYASGRRMLDDAVALLPTPRATSAARLGDLTLTSSVMLLPTPTASPWTRNATVNRDPDDDGHSGTTLADVAYADRWAQYGPAIARWEAVLGRPAPEPTVIGKRGGTRLSGRFVEWLMGWPDGWVTDLMDNTAALRVCGNGVVPQCARAAYRMLMEMSA